jgi:DNA invertase Pin-like site-specific DNA recombinase
MKRVGYARGQDLDVQVTILAAAGCREVVTEHAGPREPRTELDALVAGLAHGDALVIVRLSSVALNTAHLLRVARALHERGCSLVVTGDDITRLVTGDGGQLAVLLQVDECQRQLISEATRAGIERGRRRGGGGGRKPKLGPAEIAAAQALYDAEELTGEEIAAQVGVSKATLYRHIDTRADRPRVSVG